ncbi:MAG: peptide chain release factor N(5)-glutamine methyltransferase [Acidobacteriaceae bacterium]
MQIREARPDDAQRIAWVHLESWKATYPGIIPQSYIDGLKVEDGAARWRERLTLEDGPIVFVAEDEAGIFGFAAAGTVMHPVEGFDGELGAIYLLASHHRRGAGAALARRMAQALRQHGFRSMVVWALKENPACGFYERMGGVVVGEQDIEIGGVTLPEVAYGWRDVRTLAPDAATDMPIDSLKNTLHEAAARLAPSSTARRDAELLLLRAVGRDRAWLLAHSEAELPADQRAQFEAWIERRARHEPVQYILGEQEFYGLAMRLTPEVLIPRPETEHLVEAVLGKVSRNAPLRICDVGTGSGAIAVALAHQLPQAQVTAVDVSPAALEIARENAVRHGVVERVRFVVSDLLSAIAGERFDVVVSNPPYVAEGETLELQIRDYEPRGALFAGPTGLEIYERLIPQAWQVLVPGGWLLLEIGHGQQPALANLLREWDEVSFVADLQGISRVAIARRDSGE